MSNKSGLLVGTLLAALALAAAGCSSSAQDAGAQPTGGGRGGRGAAEGPIPVAVAPVVQQAMPVDVRVIGTTEPFSTVAVHAQITGELTSVTFTEGDDVKKGQVLFTLDQRPFEAALQQAEANLARDQAQAVNARAQATRYRDLAQRGIATKEQVDQINTNAAAADATVVADRAAVENAKVQLQYATIAAPISGRTGALMVHAGNLVRATDATPLVVINQVTPIYVSFGLPEAQLPSLKHYMAEQTLHVSAHAPNESGPASTGRITFVDNTVDQTTGTIKIKGTFPNEDRRLWPGQFVNVVVTLTTDPHAIVVPIGALQSGQQGQYVFVVSANQTAELRTVAVARTTTDSAVIQSGLQPGETVVTDGQLRLVAGSKVTVKTPTNASKTAP
jgi:multidrug efflux system membrane fusion protein